MATLEIGDSTLVFDGGFRQLPGGMGEYAGRYNEGARVENGRIIDGTLTMIYRMDDGIAFARIQVADGQVVSRNDYLGHPGTGRLDVMRVDVANMGSVFGVVPTIPNDPDAFPSIMTMAYATVASDGTMTVEERDALNIELDLLDGIGEESIYDFRREDLNDSIQIPDGEMEIHPDTMQEWESIAQTAAALGATIQGDGSYRANTEAQSVRVAGGAGSNLAV